MKELLMKRNKLRNDAMKLRSTKFDRAVTRDRVGILNKEQNNLWDKYKFYDNFIKTQSKEKSKTNNKIN